MRKVLSLLSGVFLAAALSGCCSSPCPSPCQPAPAACEPCVCWAEPIYGNSCGGDQGVGRDGTGAFAR